MSRSGEKENQVFLSARRFATRVHRFAALSQLSHAERTSGTRVLSGPKGQQRKLDKLIQQLVFDVVLFHFSMLITEMTSKPGK